MTARSAATASSFIVAGALALAGCTGFYEIPIETPIQPKMDVTAFRRVLVAGFISGGSEDVDANTETVRLLRSQLRTKTNLRVIEAEVLPLTELATEQARNARNDAGSAAAIAEATPPPVPPLPAAASATTPTEDGRK